MSETSKNKIYYNDNENSVADVLADMKKMAESTDKAIENSKYNDAQIKKDISDAKKEQALKDAEQDNKIIELQNEKAKLEKELKEAQEDFYQNSIRGQASGEYIHVEDSSNCRAKIGIVGNHEQETRSGKNKIEITKTTTTVNGCTHTIKDGTDTLSGTSSTNWANLIIYSFVGDGKTYTLSGSPSTSKNIFISAHDNVQKKDLATSKNGSTGTFVATSGNSIDIIICVAPNLTLANELFKPQLEEGLKATGYEQGGAMPSPNYLSEIESVGSDINILPSDLFLSASLNGINYTNKDGIITVNGTATENSFYTKTITLKAGTYTLNGAPKGSVQDRYCLQAQGLGAGDFGSGQIFTIDTEKQVTLRIMVWKGITVNNIIFKPKLIKGTEVGEYSKYGQGCVKVTKRNKNIMPINIGTNYAYTSSGIKHLNRENGTEITRLIVKKGQIIKVGLKLISKPTNDTTFSFYFKSNDNNIGSFSHIERNELNQIYEKEYTAIEDGEFFIKIWGSPTPDIFEFQLWAELNILTDYVQHEGQSYIMPVQQEMLVNDYLDYDNEEEVHIWGKKILTGDEGWRMPSSNDSNVVFANLSNTNFCDFNSDTDIQYSNHFKHNGIAQGFAAALNKGIGMYSFLDSEGCRYEYIVVPKTVASSVNKWKEYLKSQYDAGTPVVIYYKQQTPTRLKFTDGQKVVAKELSNARTYKNVTNITTDSKAILSLDYVKDQETQNQKMQNEIDEIKQLLSTTQTSAMLLDNLQKEVESEVE